MATFGSTAYFATLAARVEPLGGKARGMRLTAEDWNSLVGVMVDALLKIGRAQDEARASLDRAYAPADHEHPSEVTAWWLEPELRNQIVTGGGSLETRQRIATLQQRIDSLQAQVSRLAETVEASDSRGGIKWNLTQLDWNPQWVNTTTYNALDTRIAEVEEHRFTMDAIVKTQFDFKKDVETLVDLRSQLTEPDGAPIDVAALARRVTDLDALREQFEGVDGKPLHLKELQLQVPELADRPGAGGQLDARLAEIKADLAQVSEDADGRLHTLRGELSTASGEAVAELRGRLEQVAADSRSAAIEATTGLVREAETRLAAGFTGEIGTTRTTLMATLRQQASAAVDERLAGLDTRIEGLIDTRATELKTRLSDEIRTSLDSRLTAGLTDATGRLDARFAEIDTRLGAAAQSIPQELTKGLASLDATLRTRVDSQVAAKTTELNLALTKQVNQKVAAGINAGLIEVRNAASQTVTDRLANLDTRIASSVAGATRTLPDQITATVNTRLQQANIPGQIAAANNQLGTQLRSEIATSAATLQRNNSTALSSALVTMRGEFAAGAVIGPNLGRGFRPGPS